MKNSRFKMVWLIAIIFCATYGIIAQEKTTATVNVDKGKYKKIEVTKFDVSVKVGEKYDKLRKMDEFPESSLNTMMSEIVNQLTKLKKFKEIKIAAEKPKDAKVNSEIKTDESKVESEPTDSTLYLSGDVKEYLKGNRLLRYSMPETGVGNSRLKIHLKLTDSKGAALLETDIETEVEEGFFGGDSKGVTKGAAKDIANLIKKIFF
jgi:hypothetical protein